MIPEHAATIYADSLPEKQIYEQLGYRNFFRRRENGIDASDLVRCRGAAARALLHQYHSAQLA